MGLRVDPASGTAEVVERPDFPVNRGALCGKGQNAAEVLRRGVRLTAPLIRDPAGVLREATWDAALDRVAAGLADTARR